ncbi:hypothetical protein EDC01DRAFT_616783 [Geopyxis carbonaria]|nr:hypothetical protein EDC01DRAFT_616783 [Geopyxis carbonaria]
MGVAGVFLMVLGLAYGLIGIKVKRLHIFLSTAFLVGLAVTVLIVYVMNPPVKNAIQGAYVVASVVTGLIAGGLAVVFPEVTEGLGCLLGGFCLAMWFLILKPGGLLTETYGKIIMIAVFSLVTFGLAFHRVTKPIGLIFSLSFAGATATILGVDCFSRAGMKEFWLYIWALNNDRMFPLNTNTYPHTRGIRVEIAGIIILTALGIMSQVKLWKIVRERREIKDVAQREQDAQLEAMDEETGRRVEEQNQIERKEWEAIYGNGEKEDKASSESERPSTGRMSKTDSGLGDEVYKKGEKSQETFVETEEMREARHGHIQMVQTDEPGIPSVQSGVGNSTVPPTTIPVGVDDITTIPVSVIDRGLVSSENLGPSAIQQSETISRRESFRTADHSHRESAQSSVERTSHVTQHQKPKELHLTPVPPVVPLPLPVQQDYDDSDDRSSVATAADSNHRSMGEGQITFEMARSVEFDRASSIAATCDGAMEDENLPELTRNWTQSPTSPRELATDKRSAEPLDRNSKLSIQLTNENNRDSLVSDKAGSFSDIKPELLDTREASIDKSTTARDSVEIKQQDGPRTSMLPEDLAPASHPKSKPSSTVSRSGSLEVQTHCSKIVKTFRTNEWAKHLTEADKPDLDELDEPSDTIYTEEKPAPLDIHDLQETAEINSKQPVPQRAQFNRKSSTPSPPTRVNSSPLPAILPEASSQSPSFIEDRSPIERSASVAEIDRHRYSNPSPQNTLMSHRDSIVRSRSSLNALPEYGIHQAPTPAPVALPRSNSAFSERPAYNSAMRTLSRQPSANNLHGQMLSDDMPLSDRQHILHQSLSIQSLRPQQSRSITPQMPPQRRESPQIQVPKRASVETFNQWREGLRTDPRVNGQTLVADQRREEMLSERNRLAILERQRMQQGHLTGDMIEDRMRQKDMLELHREAMRKMQSSANKHVT